MYYFSAMRILLLLFISIVQCNYLSTAQSNSSAVTDTIPLKNPADKEMKVSIQTDFLMLMNSAVDHDKVGFTFGGEVSFRRSFGVDINFRHENDNILMSYSSISNSIMLNLRWYIIYDDFTGLHVGMFSSLENLKFRREGHKSVSWFFEPGISGGFKQILFKGFYIDPVAYAGLTNRIAYSYEGTYFEKPASIDIAVSLMIGYKF